MQFQLGIGILIKNAQLNDRKIICQHILPMANWIFVSNADAEI